jgi:Fe(3+) dicitrate transport protein
MKILLMKRVSDIIGLRGHIDNKLSFDTSIFGLYYNDKIGDYDSTNSSNQVVRIRANTGTAPTVLKHY